MKRSDKLPLRVRARMAARAAVACLRGDSAVMRVPGRAAERQPGLCRSLGECFRTCSQRDQAAVLADELLVEIYEVRTARSRAAHPSTGSRS